MKDEKMNNYLYDDDCQLDEFEYISGYTSEQEYWDEVYDMSKTLKKLNLHK